MTKPRSDRTSLEQAKTNAKAIREFHHRGRESLKCMKRLHRSDPSAVKYGHRKATLEREAQRMGVNIDVAAKMRRVAEEYSADQINAIVALVSKHKSPFGPSHLMILLSLEDRARRDAIMEQAIHQSWGAEHLRRAIQAGHRGRRPHVGRKPRIPDDPIEQMIALDGLCLKLRRFCDAVLDKLPAALRNPVSVATQSLKEVQIKVSGELHKSSKRNQQR